MGRGAEASELVVTSICSGVEGSMVWSWGDWRMPGPPPRRRGLRAQQSPPENLTGLKRNREEAAFTTMARIYDFLSCVLTRAQREVLCFPRQQIWNICVLLQLIHLRGVLGLPTIRRGERIFGSNENFSLMFSRTDGATYVKPYKTIREKAQGIHIWEVGCWQANHKQEMVDNWGKKSS